MQIPSITLALLSLVVFADAKIEPIAVTPEKSEESVKRYLRSLHYRANSRQQRQDHFEDVYGRYYDSEYIGRHFGGGDDFESRAVEQGLDTLTGPQCAGQLKSLTAGALDEIHKFSEAEMMEDLCNPVEREKSLDELKMIASTVPGDKCEGALSKIQGNSATLKHFMLDPEACKAQVKKEVETVRRRRSLIEAHRRMIEASDANQDHRELPIFLAPLLIPMFTWYVKYKVKKMFLD